MKKITTTIVAAVTVLLVVLVAFFGTKPQGIIEVVYITSVTITPSDNSQYKEDGDPRSMLLVYDVNKEIEGSDGNKYMPYIFNTKVLPEDATNRSFVYYIDENSTVYMDFPSENETARYKGIFFVKRNFDKKFGSVDVHCRATDGGQAKDDTLRVIIDYRTLQSQISEDESSSTSN